MDTNEERPFSRLPTSFLLRKAVKAKKLGYILNNSGADVLITHTSKARTVLEAVG